MAIHDTIRAISQGDGQPVYDAVEGMRLLASGKAVNYSGASGPCDFTPRGRHRKLQVPLRRRGGRAKQEAAVAVLTDALQLALNGAMEGAVLAVPAIGFNAVYAVLRFANFAVAASPRSAPSPAGWRTRRWAGRLAPSLLAAFVVAGRCRRGDDESALRPLRRPAR